MDNKLQLSGGEAQRISLKNFQKDQLEELFIYLMNLLQVFILMILKALEILKAFVNTGNTVIVIEHNLDVIKTADWIVDMGPEGGAEGGKIIAEGTPEKVAETRDSYTGKFLKNLLINKMKKLREINFLCYNKLWLIYYNHYLKPFIFLLY